MAFILLFASQFTIKEGVINDDGRKVMTSSSFNFVGLEKTLTELSTGCIMFIFS